MHTIRCSQRECAQSAGPHTRPTPCADAPMRRGRRGAEREATFLLAVAVHHFLVQRQDLLATPQPTDHACTRSGAALTCVRSSAQQRAGPVSRAQRTRWFYARSETVERVLIPEPAAVGSTGVLHLHVVRTRLVTCHCHLATRLSTSPIRSLFGRRAFEMCALAGVRSECLSGSL